VCEALHLCLGIDWSTRKHSHSPGRSGQARPGQASNASTPTQTPGSFTRDRPRSVSLSRKKSFLRGTKVIVYTTKYTSPVPCRRVGPGSVSVPNFPFYLHVLFSSHLLLHPLPRPLSPIPADSATPTHPNPPAGPFPRSGFVKMILPNFALA